MSRQFDDLMLGSLELFCLAAELKASPPRPWPPASAPPP